MDTITDAAVVGIFDGPGGWSEGLRRLGITDAIGYEKDPDACATAEAAGHKRILADVSMVDLRYVARPTGLTGSPPCQSFSSAGRQKGTLDKPRILAHVARIRAAGRWLHYSREGWHDPRSPLVLEPLRWALALRPEWIALEQVPAVLPLWEAFAEVLAEHGYHVAVGALSAEQYGVPQTRKRAFLIARRCLSPYPALDYDKGAVRLPAPTHRPYRKGVARDAGDPLLLPWVSMADALGVAGGGLVGFPRRPDTCAGHMPPGTTCSKHGTGEVIELEGGIYKRRDMRLTEEPAKTLTEHVRSWQLRPTAMPNATVRVEDEPAPTLTAGHDSAERVWEPVSMAQAGATSTMVEPRPVDTPGGTITGKGTAYWVGERPATTVQGDPRIWPPGHKVNSADRERLGAEVADERYGDRAGKQAVRVTVAQAAVLQSFPADYPWQGSNTAKYRQVGDAVPPMLAEAVLRAAIGP